MRTEEILRVKIDNLGREEILRKIEEFLEGSEFHQVATINPEFILEAQKNKEFREILNGADLRIADGFGIKCAFWRYFKNLKCRMTGADLLLEILKIAEKRGLGVFLACRKDGLTSFEEAKKAILKLFPKLNVEGKTITSSQSLPTGQAGSPYIRGGGFDGCEILICNFGAPDQEFFIKSQKDGKMRLAIGVGGALDFMSGKIRRSPEIMRKWGLEWLWRFLKEPRYRWKRVFRAVIVFPIKVIFNK